MLSRMRGHYATAAWVLASATVAGSAWAADATTAGELRAPYPTLENLSLEWAIAGDDDGDAIAEVRFRKAGEVDFRRALDLVRVPAGENEGFEWENKLSGSVRPRAGHDLRNRGCASGPRRRRREREPERHHACAAVGR